MIVVLLVARLLYLATSLTSLLARAALLLRASVIIVGRSASKRNETPRQYRTTVTNSTILLT